MAKEYRLRIKHQDLVMVTRTLGNHLLRELPNREWDDELAHIYNLFKWFIDAMHGRRGRKADGMPSYSRWLRDRKDYILRHIDRDLAGLSQ